MKEGTKLALMFAGAGVASNMLLGNSVGGYTSAYAMPAAAAEGVGALGGAYYAWKKKSKAGALIGGALAGLLVSTVQSGALSAPPPAAPKSTPQSSSVSAPKPPSSTIPTVTQVPSQLPPGAQVLQHLPGAPVPNRPPNQAEIEAYNQYLQRQAQDIQNAGVGAPPSGGLPVSSGGGSDGGIFGWDPFADQGGAAMRVGMSKRTPRGGFGRMR